MEALVKFIVALFNIRALLNLKVESYNAKAVLDDLNNLFNEVIKLGNEAKKALLPGVKPELLKDLTVAPNKNIPESILLGQIRMLAEDIKEFRARFVAAHKDQLKTTPPAKKEEKPEPKAEDKAPVFE